jgi:hypothetical protein
MAGDDAVGHEHQAGGDRDRAGQVERAPLAAPEGRDHARGGQRETERHGRVDEQDPAPRQRLHDQPADQRPRGAAQRAQRSPQPERAVARGALVVHVGQDRERRRRHDGAAEALRGARRHEHDRVLGQPAGQRGQPEEREAGAEDLAAPEQVGGTPAEQEEARAAQRVRAHHPLQPGRREAEVGADRRQRDVDHRHVEDAEELREAAHDEDDPPPVPADEVGWVLLPADEVGWIAVACARRRSRLGSHAVSIAASIVTAPRASATDTRWWPSRST